MDVFAIRRAADYFDVASELSRMDSEPTSSSLVDWILGVWVDWLAKLGTLAVRREFSFICLTASQAALYLGRLAIADAPSFNRISSGGTIAVYRCEHDERGTQAHRAMVE